MKSDKIVWLLLSCSCDNSIGAMFQSLSSLKVSSAWGSGSTRLGSASIWKSPVSIGPSPSRIAWAAASEVRKSSKGSVQSEPKNSIYLGMITVQGHIHESLCEFQVTGKYYIGDTRRGLWGLRLMMRRWLLSRYSGSGSNLLLSTVVEVDRVVYHPSTLL